MARTEVVLPPILPTQRMEGWPVQVVRVPPQTPSVVPPRLAFVGEAPGVEELDRLQPLVGPSGRVFNSILRTAGLERGEFLVTNVFDEKIPDNEIANWTVGLAEARALQATHVPPLGSRGFLHPNHHRHLDRLRAELEEWKPTVVVPLGGTALWALTGQDNISAHRGSVIAATKLVPGTKLLPTFHPAHVIRQWKFYSVVVADILKADAQARLGPQIITPRRELLLEPTLQDIRNYLPRLLSSPLLSVDIETGWGQITCIGFSPDTGHGICIPFVDLRKPDRSYWPDAGSELAAWRLVGGVLGSDVPKLGQNFGGYDAYWLLKKKHMAIRNFREDTRLLHHALFPELPKSLEFMSGSYSTQGAWKTMGKQRAKRDD